MWARAVIAVVLLGVAGWLHGQWTDRWGVPAVVAESAATLTQLPMTIGEWEGRDVTADESEAVYRELAPTVIRYYTHRRHGTTVGLLLTCGRPAPMIYEHTPRTCYGKTGFAETAGANRITVAPAGGGPTAQFLVHNFVKESAASTNRLRVFWAWGDRETWSSPEEPRFTLGRKPVLFKVYVTRDLVSEEESVADDPAIPFMQLLIPELQKVVNPSPPA
jgi:hypothetical protein